MWTQLTTWRTKRHWFWNLEEARFTREVALLILMLVLWSRTERWIVLISCHSSTLPRSSNHPLNQYSTKYCIWWSSSLGALKKIRFRLKEPTSLKCFLHWWWAFLKNSSEIRYSMYFCTSKHVSLNKNYWTSSSATSYGDSWNRRLQFRRNYKYSNLLRIALPKIWYTIRLNWALTKCWVWLPTWNHVEYSVARSIKGPSNLKCRHPLSTSRNNYFKD